MRHASNQSGASNMRLTLPQEHKSWEDWAVFALGGALLLSPILDSSGLSPLAITNLVIVGFAIMAVAVSELILPERWDARTTLILGVWMIIAPYVIGYVGRLGFWHGVIGALIAVLSAFELWQDLGHNDASDA
jgi:SPW repeat